MTTDMSATTASGYRDRGHALITVTAALHDLKGARQNSPAGSVYCGEAQDARARRGGAGRCRLFDLVEDALGLARNTVKIGIMDEERRTSANLKACISPAKDRVVFINTGFLDRTGRRDPHRHGSRPGRPQGRHQGRALAARLREAQRRDRPGHRLPRPSPDRQGHVGRARHDEGHAEAKIGHPKAGANTAWVPSPTAAVLHAAALPRGRRAGAAGDHGRRDRPG
jgi:malate synthase